MKQIVLMFLVSLSIVANGQEKNKMNYTFQLDYGIPFELPHKNIFKKNASKLNSQYNLKFQLHLNEKFYTGLEFQATKSNLRTDFIKTYKNILYQDDVLELTSHDYHEFNVLVNGGYKLKNKKNTRGISASLGLGVKSSLIKNNTLNAIDTGRETTFHTQEKIVVNPLIALGVDNTWCFKKIGINVGLMAQYTMVKKPIVYIEHLFINWSEYEIYTNSVKNNYFTLVPSIGVNYTL